MGLEHLEFAMTHEGVFKISISHDETAGMRTAGDVHDVVIAKLRANGNHVDEEELWRELTKLILETGDYRKPERQVAVSRSTRLIDDLGWG